MISQSIYDEACDWIIRLDPESAGGAATAAERVQFVRWLNRCPENAKAYGEMSQVWARMDTLGRPGVSGHALPGDGASPVRAAPGAGFGGFVAASLAVILTICVAVVLFDPQPGGDQRQFVTALDQQHEIVANDGSVIALGPGTALTMDWSSMARAFEMERGDALFTVAENRSRPFMVRVGNSTVTALGTVFRVSRGQGLVQIEVLEGRVGLHAGTDGMESSSELVLEAGQVAHFQEEASQLRIVR